VIHKRLAAEWASIRTHLEEIITIPYSGRKDCKTFLKLIKTAINTTAIEGSMIPKHIRDACYEKFNNIDQFDIPDICGQMEHTRVKISGQPLLSNAPMN
jgi:hypothetical protein